MSEKNYVTRTAGGDAAKRDPDDFYPTPAWATCALLDAEKFSGRIWEPACGDGAISKELMRYGYETASTDLFDYGFGIPDMDFLHSPCRRVDNIVTNPPFRHSEAFLHQALRFATKKVALLNRLSWLEGSRRYARVFNGATPLARVYVFSSRVHFHRSGNAAESGGGGMIPYAWFVWEIGYVGSVTLKWLPPMEKD